MMKMVKIRDETHSGLKSIANYGDTLDGVIQRLINFYLAANKGKGGKVKA